MPPITVSFLIFFPNRPLIRKPMKGKSGYQPYVVKHVRLLYVSYNSLYCAGHRLPLHQVDVFDVDGFPVVVEGDHQRQTYGSLGRGNSHDEEDEYLAVKIPQVAGKGTKVRLTALSISSMHMKITMAFFRVRTPIVPMENRMALTMR